MGGKNLRFDDYWRGYRAVLTVFWRNAVELLNSRWIGCAPFQGVMGNLGRDALKS